MNSCGRRGDPVAVAELAGDLVAAVTSTVPTKAPVTVRIPPTTSIASSSTPTSSVYCFGVRAADGLHPQRAGERRRSAMLSDPRRPPRPEAVDADRRGGDLVLPGGDRRSDRRASRGSTLTTISAAERRRATATCSSPWRGTPDSPPAPRVSSCQFLTTWSTTNSTASVIIVAASPPARATATPTARAERDGDDDPDDRGAERAELDVADAERQVRAASTPSSPPGSPPAPCRRRRSGRRPGGRRRGSRSCR